MVYYTYLILYNMTYGIKLKSKQKHERIIKAGYQIVPTHAYSGMTVDNQYITEWINHKRFHIIKVGREYFIHQDYFAGATDEDFHKTTTSLNDDLIKEIKRI